jgi:virginiamycin B lyase
MFASKITSQSRKSSPLLQFCKWLLKIGRITTDGLITEFPLPAGSSDPYGIAAGPDGALWFTEPGGAKIGSIPTSATPANPQITEFPISSGPSNLAGITAGPDGALWFLEQNADLLISDGCEWGCNPQPSPHFLK